VPKPAAKSAGKSTGKEPSRPSRITSSIRAERKAARASVRAQLNELRRFTKGSPLKRGVIFASIGSVAVLVALVLATIFTPMMAIDKIEIVGLHRLKQATVYNAVKSLEGTPLTLVDEGQIQKRLAGFPLIQSFTTVSLPPHTLQLYIQERQPIGVVTIGSTDYLYDPAGVQIGPTKSRSKYPLILVNGDPAKSSNYREAVQVLLALPTTLYPNVASIQATSVDDVRIHLRGIANKQILWGDSSQSLLKSKVLTALMANVRKNTSVVLDVSSPTAPTVRYGNF
jgi:cell division protein FtsQ